ncbi:MAG: hypothetical protein WBO45_23465 [Planctomycetota bacterium]
MSSLLGAQVAGGNLLQHYDGTAEATSRGHGLPSESITVLQRYPWNQCCNRTKLCCVEATLQDQNPATPEWLYLEVRASDLTDALFPLGKPDLTPGGLLYMTPLLLAFTGPVQKFSFNLPCVPLPAGPGATADFYVGFRFNPAPTWPADGVSCHFSGQAFALAGEQFLSPPNPMYAAAPKPGLGWSNSASAGLKINNGDLAWAIAAGLFEDVCQPFAHNPGGRFTGTGGTGLDPNFGYAGIWPDIATMGDQVGWRVRTVAPPSSLCVLFLGFNLPAPIDLGFVGIDGLLCIDPLLHLVAITTPADGCATQSQAVFGPFNFGNAGGTVLVGAQAVTVDLNSVKHLSTACTTAF